MIKNWPAMHHFHFIILCGTQHPSSPDTVIGAANIEVICGTEEQALKRAKEILNRPHYQITAVKECFAACEPKSIEVHIGLHKSMHKLDGWDEPSE